MQLPDNSYVAMATMGHCKVCSRYQDLRMGCCFDCSKLVTGKELKNGNHELWVINNPNCRWIVRVN